MFCPALTPAALPGWHSPGPPHRSGVQLAGGPESVSSFIEMPPQLCPSSGFQNLKAHALAFSCFLSHPGNKSLFLGTQGWRWACPLGASLPVLGLLRRGEALQIHAVRGGGPGRPTLNKGPFLKGTASGGVHF